MSEDDEPTRAEEAIAELRVALTKSETFARERDNRLVLAASRGAYVAVVQPNKSMGDAARAFGYEARTFEGDAFETAFEWARENVRMDTELKRQVP